MGCGAKCRGRHGQRSRSPRGLVVEHRPVLGPLSEGLRELHPARILVSARPATGVMRRRAPSPSTGKRKMKLWQEITHYAGFDWAHDHHDVVIVDRHGEIVADFSIGHTAQGWQRWREHAAEL